MTGWDRLASRVAIVTGASSGIGASIAARLGREGMRIVLAARRAVLLEQVAARVRDAGGEALVVPTDVRDPVAIEQMASAATAAWGRIDVLVANAGIGGGSVLRLPDAAVTDIVEVNLLGVVRCARAVVPAMQAQREGHIIAVSSVAGRIMAPGSIYGVTKAAVLAFCEALRRAVAADGIAVSAVLPGWIATPMIRGVPPRWLAPPSVVADAVVRLLRDPRPEVVVPGWYRPLIALGRTLPAVADRFFAYQRRSRAQPREGRGG
ncbi:MAG: SDR family NAD(P)-dependent oxidoreductase [Armatimonadetes bacterium]|nr:SDR family NAD(P)-dependent oxidoreductase [Armatimonadota bacterium]